MPQAPKFGLLTNHGNTLLILAGDPRIRMRDIATLLDITERATQKIVSDLDQAGYIVREREGRRNHYTVRARLPLGSPKQRDLDIRALLGALSTTRVGPKRGEAAARA